MASRRFLVAAVGLLGTTAPAFAEEVLATHVVVEDECAAGQDSEACTLSLLQARGRKSVQDVSTVDPDDVHSADMDPFCCYAFNDAADKCGTCQEESIAPPKDYCSAKDTCGGCGGYWCKSQCVKYENLVDADAPSPEGAEALVQEVASQGLEARIPSGGLSPEASGDGDPFCSGLFTDADDPCGSVHAKAPAGDTCAERDNCGGCGGYWCKPQCIKWHAEVDPTAAERVKPKAKPVTGKKSHRRRRRRRSTKAAPAEEEAEEEESAGPITEASVEDEPEEEEPAEETAEEEEEPEEEEEEEEEEE